MLRPILDLQYINSFVYKDRKQFNEWRTMKNFVDSEVSLYKSDVIQGYHHIHIDKNHQKCLGFS